MAFKNKLFLISSLFLFQVFIHGQGELCWLNFRYPQYVCFGDSCKILVGYSNGCQETQAYSALNQKQIGMNSEVLAKGLNYGTFMKGNILFNVTFSSPGTYTFFNSNRIARDTLRITVYPKLKVSFNLPKPFFCKYSNSIELTGGLPEGGRYFLDNNMLVTSIYPPLMINDSIPIKYIVNNEACKDSSNSLFILKECEPLSIPLYKEIQTKTVCSPNPANDQIKFLFNLNETNGRYQIFNSIGKMMINKEITSNEEILNISEWPSGIYNLKLITPEKSEFLKFVRL